MHGNSMEDYNFGGGGCKITVKWLRKGKGKVHPRTGHEQAERGSRGIALPFL